MKNHLKAATDSFGKLKIGKKLINPISEIDAEIVFETINYLKKINQTQIWTILESWKYLKDEEIRDQLLQLNIDTQPKQINSVDEFDEENEKKFFKEPFIKLKDRVLQLSYIHDIKRYCEWDVFKKRETYYILINEAEKCTGMCVNVLVEYMSEKERDKDFDLIQKNMEQSNTIEFIN